MGLIEKIIGTYSERQLKKIMPLVDATEALAPKYAAMSEAELRGVTEIFKKRLADGETLDDILPDTFAAVREAATRVLGKRPFRVQIMGGIVIHQGRIAEMKTGEGKTLVATMPAYLNALTGKGVHIVTVNDYLARVGRDEMGKVYEYLGLSTGLILQGQSGEDKRKAYACDITYGTNNEMGFDYLRDNMVIRKEQLVQRPFNFAIVDEVDSILIDEARTPLIISGRGEQSDDIYKKADALVRQFRPLVLKEVDKKADYTDVREDYIVDEKGKHVSLTARGIEKAERFFGVENISDAENLTLMHHIEQAMYAYGIKKRDVDYVVSPDGKVLIVDTFTGRIMPGRRFSNGLHQAIEAKERVKIENENQTLATITFQNYFRLYKKLSGMTGTALTEDAEFREIYGLDVVEIPTNKPMIRIDHEDAVYKNLAGKYRAIIGHIKSCYEKGQPVLVGTVSVDKSEFLSSLLKKEGIPHNVLNAKQHEREAEIVAQAGKPYAVTISTNMAGRGTDIMLGGNAEFMAKNDLKKEGYNEEEIFVATGVSDVTDERLVEARKLYHDSLARHAEEIAPEAEKVREAGGLCIIGTERHESRRIDNQLRGRSGRQGDPGESKFYLSLQDDLMRLFGSERILGLVDRLGLDEDQEINARILSNSIENAQKHIEGENFNIRKNVLEYDDVMNQQRNIIYGQRRDVIDGKDISETIEGMLSDAVATPVALCTGHDGKVDTEALHAKLFWLMRQDELTNGLGADEVTEKLNEKVARAVEIQKQTFGDKYDELCRIALLRAVDTNWMAHLDAMDDLREGVGFQQKPINEYRMTGGEMFDDMIEQIREDTAKMILSARPAEQVKRTEVAKANAAQAAKAGNEKQKPIVKKLSEKVGRNDPCPCGSGKKYKNCHGRNASIEG